MQTSWLTPIDNYCERLAPGFWAEPLNAISNGAFLAAAVYAFMLWRREGARDWPVLWLIAVTAIVGSGSFLFHTLANRWSLLADVLPIAVFIYSYFLLAMQRFLGLGVVSAIAATVLFAVFNMSFPRLWLGVLPGLTLNGSIGYLPAALAMVGVGLLCLLSRLRRTGMALVGAGGLFALSLFFRSIDHAVCSALPIGTHYLWHALNALVLAMLMRVALSQADREGSTVTRIEIHGYAIVSDDDRIADESGLTPEALRNDADWAYFQSELNKSAVTVLGRLGHEVNPNPKQRLRLVLSSSSSGLERREDGWWWNPALVTWDEAIRTVLPEGGRVAVPGGRQVFDLFLRIGYDAFHLTRAEGTRIPGGVAVFSACDEGKSAESILSGAGLKASGRQVLDPAGPVSLTVWRR